MSLVQRHVIHYDVIKQYAHGDMLMLGDQINNTNFTELELFGVDSYSTLDTASGTYVRDLTKDIKDLPLFDTVFNLGTIEHIWDAARAWKNALALVRPQGYFANVSPALGYYAHGIHVTDPASIRVYVESQGFVYERVWFTDRAGQPISEPKRNHHAGPLLYWFVAQKQSPALGTVPNQTWETGVWQPTS